LINDLPQTKRVPAVLLLKPFVVLCGPTRA